MLRPKTHYFEDLEIGMDASYTRVVTEADIISYADISGDFNPVHMDEEYAKRTMFKGRIAHGLLTASYISAVFGMELPGPGAIYVSQTLNFKAPVMIGATVVATVRIIELVPSKKRALFDCICTIGEKVVLDGEAMLMVPSRSDAKA